MCAGSRRGSRLIPILLSVQFVMRRKKNFEIWKKWLSRQRMPSALKNKVQPPVERNVHAPSSGSALTHHYRSELQSEHTFGTIHATKGDVTRPEPWRGGVKRPAPWNGEAKQPGSSKGEDEVRCVNPPELPGTVIKGSL